LYVGRFLFLDPPISFKPFFFFFGSSSSVYFFQAEPPSPFDRFFYLYAWSNQVFLFGSGPSVRDFFRRGQRACNPLPEWLPSLFFFPFPSSPFCARQLSDVPTFLSYARPLRYQEFFRFNFLPFRGPGLTFSFVSAFLRPDQ